MHESQSRSIPLYHRVILPCCMLLELQPDPFVGRNGMTWLQLTQSQSERAEAASPQEYQEWSGLLSGASAGFHSREGKGRLKCNREL